MIEKMSLKGFRWENQGSNKALVCRFIDGMKRPRKVEISNEPLDEMELDTKVLVGTPGAVAGIVNAFAEIAWAGGWRPVGLNEAVLKAIQTHKAPKE
jgi:hypothetical protein